MGDASAGSIADLGASVPSRPGSKGGMHLPADSPGTRSDHAGPRLDEAVVWKLGPQQELVPVKVKTGITDHTITEIVAVLGGELKEGDDVVTGSSAVAKAASPMSGATGRR